MIARHLAGENGLRCWLSFLLWILAMLPSGARAASYTFDADPQIQPGFSIHSNVPGFFQADDGNPGGYIALTRTSEGQRTQVLFPVFDGDPVVSSFSFECDVRVGNPRETGGLPADGFSINLARSDDPAVMQLLANPGGDDYTNYASDGQPENGVKTGLAISFDAWPGNVLPDGIDLVGILVRVDDQTIYEHPMPTLNGECDDPTSLQTGPYDAVADANGQGGSYTGLCWARVKIELSETGELTVEYKGVPLIEALPTGFVPSQSRLLMAGRTGAVNQNCHVDNVNVIVNGVGEVSPVITQQPQGAVLQPGESAVLSVEATGMGPLRYQWLRDNVAIPDATGPMLVIESAGLSDAGVYVVEVSDDSGTVLSEPAVVAVRHVFHVWVFAAEDLAEASAAIEQSGGVILEASEFFLRVTFSGDTAQFAEIAGLPFVRRAEADLEAVVFNQMSRHLSGTVLVQPPPWGLAGVAGLDGAGVVAGVWDGGTSFPLPQPNQAPHQDFAARLSIMEDCMQNMKGDQHAAHVIGTMAGDGSQSVARSLAGMAPGAQVKAWSFNPCGVGHSAATPQTEMCFARDIVSSTWPAPRIDLSQNSWGYVPDTRITTFDPCALYGAYIGPCEDYDRLVRTEDLPIFFAAGNAQSGKQFEASTGNFTGPKCIDPGFGTVLPTGTAKNVITVGAVDSQDTITTFSSQGPTLDGRLKPDIVALGASVRSTDNDSKSYVAFNGTSMATPAVSGIAALLIQKHRTAYGSDPSPALLKAILCNTATDLGNPGPDFKYGYGKVNAEKAVDTVSAGDFAEVQPGLAMEGFWTRQINVPAGCELRVMLAWSDKQYAGTGWSDPTLVNDLDLELVDPANVVHLPLTLDPSPLNRNNHAAPKVNTRDNVEQVVSSSATAGVWTIRVKGTRVDGTGSQPFALTWCVVCPPGCPREPIQGLFNTGLKPNGTPLDSNAMDLRFKLVSSPAGYTHARRNRASGWLADGPSSYWLRPGPENASGEPDGQYVYELDFQLDACEAETAIITGRWAADDWAELRLNGDLVTAAGATGPTAWSPLLINSGFRSGLNTLRFIVHKTEGSTTGLRVELAGAIPGFGLTPMADRTVCLGGTAVFNATATGSGPFSYSWSHNGTTIPNANTATLTINPASPGDAGQYCVEVESSCCKLTECAMLCVDQTAPAFNCPVDPIPLGCNPPLPTATDAIADAGAVVDDCEGNVVVAATQGPVMGTCQKEVVWTVTATDACNNVGTCAVTYTWVDDKTAPVFTDCPVNPIDLPCNPGATTEAMAIADAGLVDEVCDPNPTVTATMGQETATGTCGRQVVWTVTATDACNNVGTCAVTYTWVDDKTAPVFTACPPIPVDLGCNPGPLPDEAMAIAAAGAVHDTCGGVVQSASGGPITGSCDKAQAWTVTARDDCLNSSVCVVNFTWKEDLTPPVVTCQDIVIPCEGSHGANVTGYQVSATDDCGPATLTYSLPPEAVFPVGITPVTATATDGCGNFSTCAFTVTVTADGAGLWDWAESDGGAGVDNGHGVAVDPFGDVVYVGTYSLQATVGVTSLPVAGMSDSFVAKRGGSGNPVWVNRIFGQGVEIAYGVATDAQGNVYVTGTYEGAFGVTFNSVKVDPALLPGGLGREVFVVSYTPEGDVRAGWPQSAGGAGDDVGNDITVDAKGNVFVTGWWTRPVGAVRECFLLKFASTGGPPIAGPLLSNSTGTPGTSITGMAVASDSDGNAYVTGFYGGSPVLRAALAAPVSPDFSGAFVAKANADLSAWLWDTTTRGTGAQGNHDGRGIGVVAGSVYITGYFNGSVSLADVFGGSAIAVNAKQNALYDYYVGRLGAASGHAIWVTQGGGPATANEEPRDLAVDTQGNAYVTGFSQDPAGGPFVGGGQKVIVASYDSGGAVRWSRPATGTTLDNIGRSLAVDRAGCVYVTGDFVGPLLFDNSPISASSPNVGPGSTKDVFVAKLCAQCTECVPGWEPLMVDLETGIDSGPIPLGQADLDWQVGQDTSGATSEPRPTMVTSPAGSLGAGSPALVGPGVPGRWTARYCFCLAEGFGNPQLNLEVGSLNAVEVYLNGWLQGSSASPLPLIISAVNPSHFYPGENCIEIVSTGAGAPIGVAGTLFADGGRCCAYICGHKWSDLIPDGTFGGLFPICWPTEPGLAGWTVQAIDSKGNVSGSAITDENGNYCIGPLPDGTYTICEHQQDLDWVQVAPASPGCHTVSISGGRSVHDVNFGNRCVTQWKTRIMLGGGTDAFQWPNRTGPYPPYFMEEAAPRHPLTSAPGAPAKHFDDPASGHSVRHTFENVASCDIVQAELEVRMKPLGPASSNDQIRLGLCYLSMPPTNLYSWTDTQPLTAFPPTGGVWNANPPTMFTIPITGDVLAQLASDNRLDVLIEDDTVVDWMKLHVWCCGRPRPGDGSTGMVNDRNHAQFHLLPNSGGEVAGATFYVDSSQNVLVEVPSVFPSDASDDAWVEFALQLGGSDGSTSVRAEEVEGNVRVTSDLSWRDGMGTVSVMLGDEVVAEVTDAGPLSVEFSLLEAQQIAGSWLFEAAPQLSISLIFGIPVPVALAGGETVLGDRVVFAPSGPAAGGDWFQTLMVRASGTPLVLSRIQTAVIEPQVYLQNFDGFAEGTADLGDGTLITTNQPGVAAVHNQALRITAQGVGDTLSAFRIPTPGLAVPESFSVQFDFALTGEGRPGDGFSVNYGDLPAAPDAGEEGWGTGLSVCFDTFDDGNEDGLGNGVGYDIKVNGAVVPNGSFRIAGDNWMDNEAYTFDGAFRPAEIFWTRTGDSTGELTLLVNGRRVFDKLPIEGINPGLDWSFAFGARTSEASETLLIDNVEITTPAVLPPASRDPQIDGDSTLALSASRGETVVSTFRVINQGATQDLVLDETSSISGIGAAAFAIETPLPVSIPPGGVFDFQIRFTGQPNAGSIRASLNLVNNDGLEQARNRRIALSGTTVAAGDLRDTDGDGMSDLEEELAGTDPNDPGDFLQIVSTERRSEGVLIEWVSKDGVRYNVEFSETMERGSFSAINGGPITGDGTSQSYLDTHEDRTGGKDGYWRIRALGREE